MKNVNSRTMIFGIVLGLFFAQAPAVEAQESAGQILAKLANLPAAKREQVLIEGAKKEGSVTIYSSTRQDQLTPLTQAFNRKYPFLKVNAFRISSQRQATKVETEYRAGRHDVDVINGLALEGYQMQQLGALDPYESPETQFFSAAHKDKIRIR